MNSHKSSYSNIVTKISYMSHIIVYYGYLHEGAELFKQLCRESRNAWEDNTVAILNIIARNKNSRLKLAFSRNLTPTMVKWLLKCNNYLYYSMSIGLENERSYDAATQLIKSIKVGTDHLFDKILIESNAHNYNELTEFLTFYQEGNMPSHILSVDLINTYNIMRFQRRGCYDDIFMLDFCNSISVSGYKSGWRFAKKGRILYLSGEYFTNQEMDYISLEPETLSLVVDIISDFLKDESFTEKLNCETIEIRQIPIKDFGFRRHHSNKIEDYSEYFTQLERIIKGLVNLKNICFTHFNKNCENEILGDLLYNGSLKTEEINIYSKIKQVQFRTTLSEKRGSLKIDKSNVKIFIYFKDELKAFRIKRLIAETITSSLLIVDNLIGLCLNMSGISLDISNIYEIKLTNEELIKYKLAFTPISEEITNTFCIFLQSESKVIPSNSKFTYHHCFNDYRDEYSLESPLFGQIIDGPVFDDILPNSLVRINLDTNYKIEKNFSEESFSFLGLDPVSEVSPHFQICELRFKCKITLRWIIDKLLTFCKSYNNLRDLELHVPNNKIVMEFFEALDSNYTIKTLRLISNSPASQKVIDEAIKFKSQRIALDIQLNTKNKRFRCTKNRISEFYYPNEVGCDV